MNIELFLTTEEREFWIKRLKECSKITFDPAYTSKVAKQSTLSPIDPGLIDVLGPLNIITPELVTINSCDGHGKGVGFIRMRMGPTAYHMFLFNVVPILLSWRQVRVLDLFIKGIQKPGVALRVTQFSWPSKEINMPRKLVEVVRNTLLVPSDLTLPY